MPSQSASLVLNNIQHRRLLLSFSKFQADENINVSMYSFHVFIVNKTYSDVICLTLKGPFYNI